MLGKNSKAFYKKDDITGDKSRLMKITKRMKSGFMSMLKSRRQGQFNIELDGIEFKYPPSLEDAEKHFTTNYIYPSEKKFLNLA